MRRRRLAGVLVAVLLTPACTDGGSGDEAIVAFPRAVDVSAMLRRGGVQAVHGPWFVAIERGITDATGGEVTSSPSEYHVRRAGSGPIRRVPPPLEAEGFTPSAAVGDEAGVVVWGADCDGRPGGDDTPCEPGTPMSFGLDPAERTWTRLAVPRELRSQPLGVSALKTSGAGTIVVVDVLELSGARRVLLLEANGWRDLGFIDRDATDVCVTDEAVYTFRQFGADPARPASEETTTTSIRRRDRDGGPSTPLPAAPVSKRFSGTTVRLACDAGSAYLSSGDDVGTDHARLTVHRWEQEHERWRARGEVGLGTHEPAGAALSDPRGVAFAWYTPARRGPPAAVLVAAERDGPLRAVRFTRERATLLPVGGTGQVVGLDTGTGGGRVPPAEARMVFR